MEVPRAEPEVVATEPVAAEPYRLTRLARRRYLIASSVLVVLLSGYVVLGRVLLGFGLGGHPALALLFGNPVMAISGPELTLTPEVSASKIEIRMEPPMALETQRDDANYTTSLSQDGRWLSLATSSEESLKSQEVSVPLLHGRLRGYQGDFLITDVRINEQVIGLAQFGRDFRSKEFDSADLRYPFMPQNLSSTLARSIGEILLTTVIAALLVMCGSQIALFFVQFISPIGGLSEFLLGETDGGSSDAPFIDRMAVNLAIPFGFLGTLLSIWVSLESTRLDYSSFSGMLELIRTAIFSSVLGALTKVCCVARGFFARTIR